MSRHLAVSICAVLLLAPIIDAQERPAQTVTELEQRILTILEKTNTPGLIGTIVIGGDMVWTGSLGLADRTSNRPVTNTTPFRLGSISKTITSLAALLLQERHVLSLDAILKDIIPEVGIENRWTETDPIRLVHVLEHTAGFDDIHLREFAANEPEITLLDAIQYNTTSRKARWRPGTHMSYSNIGPAIAGYAVEYATGELFEDFVGREIFDVIGMRHASFRYEANVAASYKADGLTAEPYMHLLDRPSGSLSATALDMADLLAMFIDRGRIDDRQLIRESSLSRMERSETTLTSDRELTGAYGLGNFSTEMDGFIYQGHNGGVDGFLSTYGYLPAHNRGYFFSINAANGNAYQAIDVAIRGFLTRELETRPTEPEVDDDLSHLTGYYEPITVRNEDMRFLAQLLQTVSAHSENGTLVLTPFFDQPSIWIPVGGGRYRYADLTQANIAEVDGPDSTTPLLSGQPGTLHRIPAYVAWFRWLGLVFSATLLASSLLFALIWIPRVCLGRLRHSKSISVRAWPTITTICLTATIGTAVAGSADAIRRLGTLTLYSGGYWLLSWLFATLCVVSVVHAWRNAAERAPISKAVWWHAQLVTAANVIVLVYLSYYGQIGLRFWAY